MELCPLSDAWFRYFWAMNVSLFGVLLTRDCGDNCAAWAWAWAWAWAPFPASCEGQVLVGVHLPAWWLLLGSDPLAQTFPRASGPPLCHCQEQLPGFGSLRCRALSWHKCPLVSESDCVSGAC